MMKRIQILYVLTLTFAAISNAATNSWSSDYGGKARISYIIQSDVVRFFGMADSINSPLKEKVFSKSELYKVYADSLSKIRRSVLSDTFIIELKTTLFNYDLERFSIPVSIYDEHALGPDYDPYYALNKQLISKIWFEGIKIEMNSPQGSRLVYLPLSETEAIEVEGKNATIKLFFRFLPTLKTIKQYSVYGQEAYDSDVLRATCLYYEVHVAERIFRVSASMKK